MGEKLRLSLLNSHSKFFPVLITYSNKILCSAHAAVQVALDASPVPVCYSPDFSRKSYPVGTASLSSLPQKRKSDSGRIEHPRLPRERQSAAHELLCRCSTLDVTAGPGTQREWSGAGASSCGSPCLLCEK